MTEIRTMMPADADAVLEIYRQGIATGIATFETVVPDWEKFDKKFLSDHRLVICRENEVAGWAALSSVSARDCYKGVAEITIYIHEQYRGQGLGRQLLHAITELSEQNGIWSLLAVMHEENTASLALHEQGGFRTIGYRERIARLNGQWKNVVMMERRSRVTGI